jgi:hypothetical protein
MKMDLPLAIYNGLSGGKFGFLMQNDPFDESPITDEEKWDRSFAASADAFNRTGLTAAAHTVHGVAKGAANTATSGGKQIAILGALGAAAPEAAWAYIILSLVKWGVHAASMRAQAGQTPLQIAGGTAGDLTGASGVWAMLRNKDIADQHNLNLTWEQRGEAGGEGVPQLAASGFGIYWLRNFGSNSRSLSRRPNIGYGLINEDLLAQLEPSQSKRTPRTLLDITTSEEGVISSSPIPIPKNATVDLQTKVGYIQLRFTWRDANGVKYEVRVHDPTPGAPPGSKVNWRVSRTFPGNGIGGSPAQFARDEHYIGDGLWVNNKIWYDALNARKNGLATPGQLNILRRGHPEIE